VVAIPSSCLRATLATLADRIPARVSVLSVVKGIENVSFARPSRIMVETLGDRPLAVLSGPSHAEEIARGLPASVVVGGEDAGLNAAVSEALNHASFRVYTNPDAIGLELAGALKNILGIAAGICDGLGFGDNAKAALLTRGLVEMARFGVALGGREETFRGLAGVGDMITTCFSPFGRNRSVGERIGRGEPLETILAGMVNVAEASRPRGASARWPPRGASRCRSRMKCIRSSSRQAAPRRGLRPDAPRPEGGSGKPRSLVRMQRIAAIFESSSRFRVREATVLLGARCYDGAYYLAGYAIECALKACIAKRTRRYDYPPSRKIIENFYTHDLKLLLKGSGLEGEFEQDRRRNPTLDRNWTVVKDWSEQARYEKKSPQNLSTSPRRDRSERWGLTVATGTMVDRWLEDGKRLISALDRMGLGVDAALWFYFDESEEWRLIIATPKVDAEGPSSAYAAIAEAIGAMAAPFSIELAQVMAVSTHNPIVAALKKFFITRNDAILGNHISKLAIDNIYFEDACMYRSAPPAGSTERRGVVVS